MKKAKIDVLDISDAFEEVSAEAAPSEQTPPEEPDIELDGESFLPVQADETPHRRFTFLWKNLLLFGAPLLLILLAALAVYYFVFSDGKPVTATTKAGKGAAAAMDGAVYFHHLSSVVNDPQNGQKLVLFSFAVSSSREKTGLSLTGEDRELRVAASRMVSDIPSAELYSGKGREEIKKKIKAYIEERKGTGAVANVWITQWTVL